MQTDDEIRQSIGDQIAQVLRRYERQPTTAETMGRVRNQLMAITRRVKEEQGVPLTVLVDGVEREIIDWQVTQSETDKRTVHITPVVEVEG